MIEIFENGSGRSSEQSSVRGRERSRSQGGKRNNKTQRRSRK
jgi:hypothetical protein